MLFKSGQNLNEGGLGFLESHNSVTLFSAFIKLNEINNLNTGKKIERIIVRWDIQDLCLGVSDIALYKYCLENEITLYRNTRLHLKALWDNTSNIFYGSANVTGRGIGEQGKYNYELNGGISNMSLDDKVYLQNIINESDYVDESLYEKLEASVNKFKMPPIDYPTVIAESSDANEFLLSQLPMSENPLKLHSFIANQDSLNPLEIQCLAHDLALYKVKSDLTIDGFNEQLKEAFNSNGFVKAFKLAIMSNDRTSMHYGGVVEWIKRTTTTVPTPLSWELKQEQIVNRLYRWTCAFDDDYTWSVPGARSEVIYYKKS